MDLTYSEKLFVIRHYAELVLRDCEEENGLNHVERHMALMEHARRLEEHVRDFSG